MACASHAGLLPALACQCFSISGVFTLSKELLYKAHLYIHVYMDMQVCRLIDRKSTEIGITSSSWNTLYE